MFLVALERLCAERIVPTFTRKASVGRQPHDFVESAELHSIIGLSAETQVAGQHFPSLLFPRL